MTKVIKMGALSAVACAMLSTTAFAGTVNTTAFKIADEYIQGKASAALNIGAGLLTAAVAPITIAGYSPTTIPAISLANGTVVLSASSGSLAIADADVITVGTHKIVIMEDNAAANTDVVIGVYANTFGGKLSFSSDASVSYTNGKAYRLAKVLNADAVIGGVLTDANSPALGATAVTLSGVAKGTDSVNLTVELFSTDTQTLRDTATNTLVTTPVQMSASVVTAANGVIDAISAEMKLFEAAADTDTIQVKIDAAAMDLSAAATANDTAKIIIKNTKALPVGMTAGIAAASGAVVTANCTIAADRLSTECSVTNTAFAALNATTPDTDTFTITYSQPAVADRNALKDATFTVDVTYDFTTADMVDYTTSNLLASAKAAGSWTYNGYNVIVPYVHNTADMSTFIKLVNKNNVAGIVYATIQDDAGNQCQNVSLTDLPANKAMVYNDTVIKAAADAAGCSVSYPFSVDMIATVNKENVEAVASQRMGANGQRVLPVYTNRTTNNIGK